jgi:uncharacterized damage-inducible protein DinB
MTSILKSDVTDEENDMSIHKTVKEAWKANDRVNEVLLEHLTPDMLNAQTPGGGYTVARHLAHMTETKVFFGIKLNDTVSQLPSLFVNEKEMIPETNLAQIKDVMRQTSKTILETSETTDGKGNLPQLSTEAYLIHMMIHDGHHRGQILLALKTAGHPLPNEDLFWQPLNNEYA